MNASDLIDEVIDIVDAPSYSRDDVLRYLNQGQSAITGQLLIPGLDTGHESVTSVVDGSTVSLPSTYHRGLFMAMVDGNEVDVFKDIRSLAVALGGISDTEGDIRGVAVNGGSLVYQRIPLIATDIDLFFYIKPTPMTDDTAKYPSGLRDNELYDWSLINYACEKLFSKIEDGLEGRKVNTEKYREDFNMKMGELALHCVRVGVSMSTGNTNKVW